MHSLTPEEVAASHIAANFDELAEIAIGSLVRMSESHTEIVQICGPMTTGGYGDFQKNMGRFNRCVEVAQRHGLAVFDQVLFQHAMVRICGWKEGEPYPMALLEVFYGNVFSSGFISKGLFLPDWGSSVGCRWEWDFLQRQGIPVEEYPREWIDEIGQ
jgi:hypothetical protein